MTGWRSPSGFIAAVAATVLACAYPVRVEGQEVSVGSVVQSYHFDEPDAAGLERFRLLTVPWAAALPLGSRLTVSVGGAWASGRATGPDGGSVTLSGVTDTDIGFSVLLGDWLVASFDATAATGESTLTTEESLVAGVVAAELLPFAINTWGSGASVGGTVAIARQVGQWGVGLAGGYRVAGEFEPTSDDVLTYNPGDQLQARIALDRNVGGSSTLSILFGYQRFTDDQLLGANLFQSGSRINGLVSIAFPVGIRSSALIYTGVNHRSEGALLTDESFLAGAGDSPSQQLFLGGMSARTPLGRSVALLPRVDLRVFRAADGASQGWVGWFGTSIDFRLAGNSASSRLMLAPSGQVRTGKVIVEEGAESGFFGWEVGVTLRVESGR